MHPGAAWADRRQRHHICESRPGCSSPDVTRQWVAFIDLMVAVFSWPYMRDVHHSLSYLGMGIANRGSGIRLTRAVTALGGVAMILPTAGFWGTLLKKNAMVRRPEKRTDVSEVGAG